MFQISNIKLAFRYFKSLNDVELDFTGSKLLLLLLSLSGRFMCAISKRNSLKTNLFFFELRCRDAVDPHEEPHGENKCKHSKKVFKIV